jgi:hypothetical protein
MGYQISDGDIAYQKIQKVTILVIGRNSELIFCDEVDVHYTDIYIYIYNFDTYDYSYYCIN